ncbi:pectinesterase family protein [Streptomyces sp. NBC_01451]|uniref:pectinesterase family protein n=1 Tax=Streptomyces sp. NBC_01451 TaxID=2903872 RepID=UPI002E304EB2|nr:pectinesterase family protein [Streptomyces sp. NBC_01451]
MALTDIRALSEAGVPQPPPPRRRGAREFTVRSIVTVVALSIFATLLGPLGLLQSASAATGSDVTWRISSEPDEAKAGYVNMLNQIRAAVSGGYQVQAQNSSSSNGPMVNLTDPSGTTGYVTVDLHAENRSEFIRVFVRRSDAYVMGWRQGVESGGVEGGAVTLGQFFPLEPAAAPGGSSALPDSTDANTNTRFSAAQNGEGMASYTALAQQGAARDGMQITPASLNNAVLVLQDGGNTAVGYTRLAASAALQVIVAVAEATRFRNQAAATATAFGNGQPFTVTSAFMDQQNSWASASRVLVTALLAGAAALAAPVSLGGVTYVTAVALARVIMLAYEESGASSSTRRKLSVAEVDSLYVEPDPFGDYPTIQAAIDAAPSDGVERTIVLAAGTYQETIVVPASKVNLFIKGETGNAADVVITADRAHGTINPATGQPYGTQGSAVATFKASGVTVGSVTIQNTFDPAQHPEIDAYSTQAVAVAAEGDRQTFVQDRIISRQDTILAKAPVATGQYRQYFVGDYIEGSIDFIFGNATAVFDRDNIAMRNWVGGTVLAPNTDQSQKYGILITGSHIYTNGVPANTMYLGRPWHNLATVSPQAVVRDTVVDSGITSAHPWTDMDTTYSWTQARFAEYNNSGAGAGTGTNVPKLTSTQAADYTAQKYLAGTDGWNPVY